MRLIMITAFIVIIVRQRTFRSMATTRSGISKLFMITIVFESIQDLHLMYLFIIIMSEAHYLLPDADENLHRQRAILLHIVAHF